MNQDRELLELAAKAAGIEYNPEKSKPHPVSGAWWGLWLTYDRERTEFDRCYWNPLQDDGDCARLEAACGVNVKWFDHLGCVNAWVEDAGVEPEHASAHEYYADHGWDKAAARRRASVEVVASIQRAKEAA